MNQKEGNDFAHSNSHQNGSSFTSNDNKIEVCADDNASSRTPRRFPSIARGLLDYSFRVHSATLMGGELELASIISQGLELRALAQDKNNMKPMVS